MPSTEQTRLESMLAGVSTSAPVHELEFSQLGFKASPALYVKGGVADTVFLGSDWLTHNVLRTYSKDGACLAHAYFWCADYLTGSTEHWRARMKSWVPRLNTSQVQKMQHKVTKHKATLFADKDADPAFTHRVFSDTNMGALYKAFDKELNERSIDAQTRQFSRTIGVMGVYFMRKRTGTNTLNARYLLYHLYSHNGKRDTRNALAAGGIDFDGMKGKTFLLYSFKHAMALHGDGNGTFHFFDPNYGQYQLTFGSLDELLDFFDVVGDFNESDTHGKYLRIIQYE